MSTSRTIRLLTTFVAFAPAVAGGQIVRNTGVDVTGALDNRWTISQNGGASYAAASVVASPPGSWAVFAGKWVSVSTSGSGGSGDYRLRTQFTLGAGDVLSFSMTCAVDNSSLGVWLNNAQVAPAIACGSANSFQFGAPITYSSFVTGLNSLEIRWTGDATTDGAAVAFSNVVFTPGNMNPVPEPSTYALLATGLGLIAMVRKRRRQQA